MRVETPAFPAGSLSRTLPAMAEDDSQQRESPGSGSEQAGNRAENRIGELQRQPALVREIEDAVDLELPTTTDHPEFKAHWQVFAPTVAIFLLYSGGLIWMWFSGRHDTALFRLFAIVLAVGVPILTVHAFLRYETVRVRVAGGKLMHHPGWPRDTPIEVPREAVSRIIVKRGLSGRMFGGGTLVIETITGNKIAIADLARPEAIIAALEENGTS